MKKFKLSFGVGYKFLLLFVLMIIIVLTGNMLITHTIQNKDIIFFLSFLLGMSTLIMVDYALKSLKKESYENKTNNNRKLRPSF